MSPNFSDYSASTQTLDLRLRNGWDQSSAIRLKNGPSEAAEIHNWIEQNQSWLAALGVETIPFLLFSDGKSVLPGARTRDRAMRNRTTC